jgi:hypothetical protein
MLKTRFLFYQSLEQLEQGFRDLNSMIITGYRERAGFNVPLLIAWR